MPASSTPMASRITSWVAPIVAGLLTACSDTPLAGSAGAGGAGGAEDGGDGGDGGATGITVTVAGAGQLPHLVVVVSAESAMVIVSAKRVEIQR